MTHILIDENGVLDRMAIESLFSVSPPAWREPFNAIMVVPTPGDRLIFSYSRKKKKLGIHAPEDYKGTRETALKDTAIIMQAIADFGQIPEDFDRSQLRVYRRNSEKLLSAIS